MEQSPEISLASSLDAHLDDPRLDALAQSFDQQTVAAQTPEPGAPEPRARIPQDAFVPTFLLLCQAPQIWFLFRREAPLKTLMELHPSDPQLVAASNALYETIEEIPALHFLIEVEGKWMARLMVFWTFGSRVYGDCRMEIDIRRRPPADQKRGEVAQAIERDKAMEAASTAYSATNG